MNSLTPSPRSTSAVAVNRRPIGGVGDWPSDVGRVRLSLDNQTDVTVYMYAAYIVNVARSGAFPTKAAAEAEFTRRNWRYARFSSVAMEHRGERTADGFLLIIGPASYRRRLWFCENKFDARIPAVTFQA